MARVGWVTGEAARAQGDGRQCAEVTGGSCTACTRQCRRCAWRHCLKVLSVGLSQGWAKRLFWQVHEMYHVADAPLGHEVLTGPSTGMEGAISAQQWVFLGSKQRRRQQRQAGRAAAGAVGTSAACPWRPIDPPHHAAVCSLRAGVAKGASHTQPAAVSQVSAALVHNFPPSAQLQASHQLSHGLRGLSSAGVSPQLRISSASNYRSALHAPMNHAAWERSAYGCKA